MSKYTFEQTTKTKKPGFLHILLIYIIPFIIINSIIFFLATVKPEYEVIIGDTEDYISTSFIINVKSMFPYKELSVSLDGDTLELQEIGKKSFTAAVPKNGMLEISMRNFNGMPAASYEQVNTLDDNSPVIDQQVIEDGILTFHVSDTQSGIDYTSIYAVNSQGVDTEPLTIDKDNGILTFLMDINGLTIHAKDLAGNEIIATCNLPSEHGNGGNSVDLDVLEHESDINILP